MGPAKRLRSFRLEMGWSKAECARQLGCDPSLVGLLELGNNRPGLVIAFRIAELTKAWARGPISPEEWIRAFEGKGLRA